MTAAQELPQPSDGSLFEYMRGESVERRFFDGPFRKDELVWVLKSKGRRRTPEKSSTVSINENDDQADEEQENHPSPAIQETDTEACGGEARHGDAMSESPAQRLDLFLRARVMADEEDSDSNAGSRIGVRYPKGSTYTVSRSHLIRVLDKQYTGLVLVYPETPIYRRACVVYTLPGECFLEIGSAHGFNVERVYRRSTQQVIGVDKSEYIMNVAREKYPHLKLYRWDILEGPDQMPQDLRGVMVDVLAVDINGTRELEAVLQCLQIALLSWKPRLIIVKSRSLHQRLLLAP